MVSNMKGKSTPVLQKPKISNNNKKKGGNAGKRARVLKITVEKEPTSCMHSPYTPVHNSIRVPASARISITFCKLIRLGQMRAF